MGQPVCALRTLAFAPSPTYADTYYWIGEGDVTLKFDGTVTQDDPCDYAVIYELSEDTGSSYFSVDSSTGDITISADAATISDDLYTTYFLTFQATSLDLKFGLWMFTE